MKDIIKSGRPDMRDRVRELSSLLKQDPHTKRPNMDLKLISSRKESIFRVRIGDYRIVYEVDEEKKLILVTKIFPRGKGY